MNSTVNFSYLIFFSVVAALGGFLFGYDAAVISGTISQVTARFSLDEIQVGWFVGCALIGSIIGVLMAGKLSDRWGRKITMLVAAVFFSVSGIACAFVGTFEQLVVARILGGIGIGVVSIVSPLYISEIPSRNTVGAWFRSTNLPSPSASWALTSPTSNCSTSRRAVRRSRWNG